MPSWVARFQKASMPPYSAIGTHVLFAFSRNLLRELPFRSRVLRPLVQLEQILTSAARGEGNRNTSPLAGRLGSSTMRTAAGMGASNFATCKACLRPGSSLSGKIPTDLPANHGASSGLKFPAPPLLQVAAISLRATFTASFSPSMIATKSAAAQLREPNGKGVVPPRPQVHPSLGFGPDPEEQAILSTIPELRARRCTLPGMA